MYLVTLGRCDRQRTKRAVQDNGVLLRPKDLDDLLQFVLSAEPIPSQPGPEPSRPFERDVFDRYLRFALLNENVLAFVEEIGGT